MVACSEWGHRLPRPTPIPYPLPLAPLRRLKGVGIACCPNRASLPRTNPNPLPLAPLRRGKGNAFGRLRSSFPFAKGKEVGRKGLVWGTPVSISNRILVTYPFQLCGGVRGTHRGHMRSSFPFAKGKEVGRKGLVWVNDYAFAFDRSLEISIGQRRAIGNCQANAQRTDRNRTPALGGSAKEERGWNAFPEAAGDRSLRR